MKNYAENVKETLEHVFNEGYDVIAIDSIAEVLEMYKDAYRTTESNAEFWFLNLQDKHKKGGNSKKYYTPACLVALEMSSMYNMLCLLKM